MKNLLKVLAISILAVSLIVVSVGCGSKKDEAAADTTVSDSAPTEDAPAEDAPAAEATGGSYKAGTYTAKATGMQELTVEVEVSDSEIVSVTVVEHEETQGIGDQAVEKLPAAIVEAQSTEVDTVAGATLTSDAIISAVNDCLAQAQA